MSGTDHARDEGWQGPTPAVILVRPQMGENIGASARAMWNFGLDRMRIVAPRDGWPNEKAVTMASGAGRVLDQVRVEDGVAQAADDLHYVYATTARDRDLTNLVLTPEEAMADAHARIGRGENVGVLFGPERSGLDNEEVARANALISVPVNPAFGSPATVLEVEKLTERFEGELERAGFFYPKDKAASMRVHLRNLFSRLDLSRSDIRIFHGIIRALTKPRQ